MMYAYVNTQVRVNGQTQVAPRPALAIHSLLASMGLANTTLKVFEAQRKPCCTFRPALAVHSLLASMAHTAVFPVIHCHVCVL